MNQRLPSYLKGEALRHWHSMAARDRSSYDRVKAHILSKLDTVQRRWKAKTEYFSATQSAGESATEFARRLYRLYELAGGYTSRRNEELSEEFLIIRFEDGLVTNLPYKPKARIFPSGQIQRNSQWGLTRSRLPLIGMVYTHNTDECSLRPTEGVPYQIPTQGSHGFSTQPACLPYGPPYFYCYQGQPFGLPYPQDQPYGLSYQHGQQKSLPKIIMNLNQPAGNQGSISFSSEQPMLFSKWDGNV